MEHFVYYPFGIDKLDKDTDASKSHFIGRYGYGCILAARVTWQPAGTGMTPVLPSGTTGVLAEKLLGKNPDEVVLIVDCHGNRGGQYCRGEKQNTTQYVDYLEADDLARQLVVDGLPSGHKWIKLNVCQSDSPEPAATDSSAKKLARALARDCPQILVAGVKGNVITIPQNKGEGFGCMKCGRLLPKEVGFRLAELASGAFDFAGNVTTYYDGSGNPRPKNQLRTVAESKKHHCPGGCGQLDPTNVGRVSYNMLRPIKGSLSPRPVASSATPAPSLAAQAAASPAPAVPRVAGRPGQVTRRCAKCGQTVTAHATIRTHLGCGGILQ
jgi:hypothetical protein